MKFSIEPFSAYFKEALPNLHKNYDWKIPAKLNFSVIGNPYHDNVNFKNHYKNLWDSANQNEKLILAHNIVSIWGGVKNNKQKTLQQYIENIQSSEPRFPLKGVASYSKIYSIFDPKEYAIYDARVAVSLNAIQYIYGTDSGVIFNYIPGRNNITGNSLKKSGFVFTPPFREHDLKQLGWKSIKKDETYQVYLELLRQVNSSSDNHQLYDLEMTLFADAERLAEKAIKKAQNY